MNKLLPIGLGAAAVVLALVAGTRLLGPPASGGLGGAPSPTPTAEPSVATPSASAASRPTPPPLSGTFTSTLHGISTSFPEGWTTRAATQPWTASTFPLNFNGPEADFLYDPIRQGDLFLTIASQPIGDSTPEDWLAEQLATPDQGCDTTEPITVDGGSGQIGCTLAVVTAAGRGYWIQLYTGDRAPATYDLAWFEEVMATVQLHPEDAVD